MSKYKGLGVKMQLQKLRQASGNKTPHGMLATLFRKYLKKKDYLDSVPMMATAAKNRLASDPDGKAKFRLTVSDTVTETMSLAKCVLVLTSLIPRISSIKIKLIIDEVDSKGKAVTEEVGIELYKKEIK